MSRTTNDKYLKFHNLPIVSSYFLHKCLVHFYLNMSSDKTPIRLRESSSPFTPAWAGIREISTPGFPINFAINIQSNEKGHLMKRMESRIWLFLIIVSVCISGCNAADDTSTSATYDEMTAKYTLLTVAELWTALENSASSYDGSYILLKGVLLSVGTNTVTLLDSDTQKAVTCTFDTSVSLTDLTNVLSNNTSSSDEDIITVGGVSHYYQDTTSYPYLESCDYFYINTDA
jgi:hypothetical protein